MVMFGFQRWFTAMMMMMVVIVMIVLVSITDQQMFYEKVNEKNCIAKMKLVDETNIFMEQVVILFDDYAKLLFDKLEELEKTESNLKEDLYNNISQQHEIVKGQIKPITLFLKNCGDKLKKSEIFDSRKYNLFIMSYCNFQQFWHQRLLGSTILKFGQTKIDKKFGYINRILNQMRDDNLLRFRKSTFSREYCSYYLDRFITMQDDLITFCGQLITESKPLNKITQINDTALIQNGQPVEHEPMDNRSLPLNTNFFAKHKISISIISAISALSLISAWLLWHFYPRGNSSKIANSSIVGNFTTSISTETRLNSYFLVIIVIALHLVGFFIYYRYFRKNPKMQVYLAEPEKEVWPQTWNESWPQTWNEPWPQAGAQIPPVLSAKPVSKVASTRSSNNLNLFSKLLVRPSNLMGILSKGHSTIKHPLVHSKVPINQKRTSFDRNHSKRLLYFEKQKYHQRSTFPNLSASSFAKNNLYRPFYQPITKNLPSIFANSPMASSVAFRSNNGTKREGAKLPVSITSNLFTTNRPMNFRSSKLINLQTNQLVS